MAQLWLQTDGDAYQVIVILKGIMQGRDPLAVSIHQNVPLFSETGSLQNKGGNKYTDTLRPAILIYL